ncbi:MAG: ATP-binding cassette domain-containing protein [Lachnospiraceae bacterium]|nr:ATP-binding cassette domain-containing protein [Lachnospiraceae bacterium]
MELEIRNLSKRYGKKQALSNVSCKLNDGVYGLLGANGAGKSTLMNIITGNIEADEGEVLLDGKNILKSENQREFREYLGYMPQFPIQYRGFTVLDFLFYMASLRGISKKKAKERIDELLEMLALTDARNKKMTALSGGMKQRLMLAQSVIGNPKVLILDEPTAGLDPKQRIAVRNLISEIAFQKIVLIATHVVTDVEFISKEIILLKDGEVIKKAERENLTADLDGKVYEIKVPVSELRRIQQSYLVGNIVKEREWIYVRVVSDTFPKEENVTIVRPSLEDVYLYYFRE